MTLWDWVVRAYSADGVAETCLELQDSAGQNVPLLLWAAWTAATGRDLDADARADACDMARAWDDSAVSPLRAVRRALKARIPDLEDAAREAIRAQVKAVELDAERRLLAALEALTRAESGPPRSMLDAMVAVARVWSPKTPRPGLMRLAERLPA